MGAPVARGQNKNNMYEWPNTWEATTVSKQACVRIKTSLENLHNILVIHPRKFFSF